MKNLDFNLYEDRQKFYNSKEWKDLRKYVNTIRPLCEECKIKGELKPAAEIHHIISVKNAPDLRLDPDNLQSLCKECHSRITFNEDVKGRSKLKLYKPLWKH